MQLDEMTLSKAAGTGENSAGASSVKTILVHIQNEDSAVQRIESALSIARAASAHVTCLQVTSSEAYVAFDGFGGVFVMNDVMKGIDESAARLKAVIEKELAREDVSWDHVHATGNSASEIVSRAALADLVVSGRDGTSDLGRPSISLLGDLVQSLRTPLFLCGESPVDPAGPAIIAWDGSYEAANAVRGAIGLLKLSSSVRVLHIGSKPESPGTFPGTALVKYLSRHGICAELTVETQPRASDDEFVAASLMSQARSAGGAYIVMGGYGHSRARQFLFGGVTRTMLGDPHVPVVIAR
jgi:nucleotide-binding universal stress UspA family protein